MTTLLIDRDEARSTATDTRVERRRFITNANVLATFEKAIKLGVISRPALERRLGRSLDQYKEELLLVFGSRGYIVNSLENLDDQSYKNVTLDFAHTLHGFWTFQSEGEVRLFVNTAKVFFDNRALQDDSHKCFLIAAQNPEVSFINRLGTASYHGRSMWPAFNVEFADRLLDLSNATADSKYAVAARGILAQLRTYIETLGYYPEILRSDGSAYRTWSYRCAHANSWFPRYESVARKADTKMGASEIAQTQ